MPNVNTSNNIANNIMSIRTEGDLHVTHQFLLAPQAKNLTKTNRVPNLSHAQQSESLTKLSSDHIVKWMLKENPIAHITMVFDCAISHKHSIELLNLFYHELCKLKHSRRYKKHNEFIMMFAFLENAVLDKKKNNRRQYENCNHFHLILCNQVLQKFGDIESIEHDIDYAMKRANYGFKNRIKKETSKRVPQIEECFVQDYFNHGDNKLEHYVTKGLDIYNRDDGLKLDQIGYPSLDGFTFGERIYK
jgi:hypothetical protein